MYLFTIRPADEPDAAVELQAIDGGAALDAASRMSFREVDVFRNGEYVFSVSKQGSDTGFWGIFQKPDLAGEDALGRATFTDAKTGTAKQAEQRRADSRAHSQS